MTDSTTAPPVPPWWDALTNDATLREPGIDWRPPAEWAPGDKPDTVMGTIQVPRFEDADTRLRAGKVAVGTGPVTTRRGMGHDVAVTWYLDPEAPDRLWCALCDDYPAWLWIPVEPAAAPITAVLAGMFPRPELFATDLTAFARGFLGMTSEVRVPNVYTGEFVELNGLDLDRYFTGVPFVEPQSWGSAHLDDPLRDDIGSVSPIVALAVARNGGHKQQRIGRIPSMTWRTMHSRSYLSIEIHQRSLVCAAVRYRPAPPAHQAVVAAVNERFDTWFPADLPLDVIGALTGYYYSDEADLIGNLTDPEDPDQLALGLRIISALRCGDLRRTLRIREYASHQEPVVRLALAQIADWYNYRFLFEDLLRHETDPTIAAAITDRLLRGSDPDAYNAFGDFFDGEPLYVDEDGNGVAVADRWSDDEDEEGDEDEGDDGARDGAR